MTNNTKNTMTGMTEQKNEFISRKPVIPVMPLTKHQQPVISHDRYDRYDRWLVNTTRARIATNTNNPSDLSCKQADQK